jgi:putative ABC transport system permease protein
VTTALFPLRFGAGLMLVLAAVGLVIACLGLYGIVSQGVIQRTRELGVRLALGAQRPNVLAMVVREGLLLAGGGLAVGLGLSVLGARALAPWLYGVSPLDPLAFVVAPVVLLTVAVLASLLPARRAARVDPVIALRAE